MRIKICGITKLEDALLCDRLGVDAVGYIFYNKSKRYIMPMNAFEISERLSPFISKVGVFVNESIENVNRIAKTARLSAVQLHGDETPEYISQIEYPVIKGFRVTDDFNFGILKLFPGCGILLDSYDDKDYGGTGKTFNWNVIPEEIKNKIILAGGIKPTNIEYIKREINPDAVDVSSSLEKSPGVKDAAKIKEIMKKINSFRKDLC